MIEFVKLNGTHVRVSGLYRRTVEPVAGPPVEELEIVVVLHGEAEHRTFLALLERDRLELDIPEERSVEATLVSSTWSERGEGGACVYRHDLTLREIPPSEPSAPPTDEPVPSVEEAARADDETGELPFDRSDFPDR